MIRGDDVHVIVFDSLLIVIGRHHQSITVGEDEFLHLFFAHHLHLLFVGMRYFPEALLLSLILLKVSLGITTFAVIGSTHRSLLLNSSSSSRIWLYAPIFKESCLIVVDGVIIVWVEHSSTISGVIGPVLLLGIILRSHGLLEVYLLQGVVDIIQVLLLELCIQLGSVWSCWLRSLNLARICSVAKRLSICHGRNIFRSWSNSLTILYLLLGLLLVQIDIVFINEKQWFLTLLFLLLLRWIRGGNHLANTQLLLILDLLDCLHVHVAILLVLVVLSPARRWHGPLFESILSRSSRHFLSGHRLLLLVIKIGVGLPPRIALSLLCSSMSTRWVNSLIWVLFHILNDHRIKISLYFFIIF